MLHHDRQAQQEQDTENVAAVVAVIV